MQLRKSWFIYSLALRLRHSCTWLVWLFWLLLWRLQVMFYRKIQRAAHRASAGTGEDWKPYDVDERHIRDNIKIIPSRGMNVSERQCVKHCSSDDPIPTGISFSSAIFQVGAAMTRVLANEMWAQDCWVGLLRKLLLYWKENEKEKKTQQAGTTLLFLPLSTSPFPCLEYGRKIRDAAAILGTWGSNHEDKSKHTKDGTAEKQKESGSLNSLLMSYIIPELTAYLWIFLT